MDATTEAFSPQIYGNYSVLDSVLIYYLDIESIVQRHQVNPSAFETQGSLNVLAQRFDLPWSVTFSAFLDRYDAKYATVRSYLLPGAEPKAIMLKAAEAGELRAFYLGLRRNPKYKNPTFLNQALKRAARGGNQVMIDLIKDLGGDNYRNELIGTAQGGHLEKLKRLIAHRNNLNQYLLYNVVIGAINFGQLAAVKYLITLWTPDPSGWNNLIHAAGVNGNPLIIDCVVSQGGNDYTEAILGAISGGHLELAMMYMEKPGLDYPAIFSQAIRFNYLDLAKLVARDRRIDLDSLNELMSCVSERTTYDTIDYLISLGGTNYRGLIYRLIKNDYIELFKRYYITLGFDYDQVFNIGLRNSSMEIVKFMLEQHLVPVTEEKLNSYLSLVGVNPELIALLFSLGATDYRTVVERALINGELELAEKYFDQATGLKLNKVFNPSTKIQLYLYLLRQGSITQKTVDAMIARME